MLIDKKGKACPPILLCANHSGVANVLGSVMTWTKI